MKMQSVWGSAWRIAVVLQTLACGSAAQDDDDDSGSESGDDEGTASCPAADPALALVVHLEGFGAGDEVVDAPCTVAALEVNDAGFELTLDCAEDAVLSVEVSPPLSPALAVGDDVLLTTMVSGELEHRRSVFVRDAGTGALEIASVSSPSTAWIDELSPLELAPISDACEPEPDEYDCLTGRRQMWSASVGGQSNVIGDDLRTRIGAYDVHMQEAFAGALLECVDIEPAVYQALVVRTP